MTQGVGLSVGASNVAAVIPGCAAVTRQPVLTLYRHRPPEVGVPAENPRPAQRGLVVNDFVDRAADPIGIVAADGSVHRGEALIADALRAVSRAVTGGRAPQSPPGVAFPAHWRPAAVDALRRELLRRPEWPRPDRLPLMSDATAALTALQADPGLPTRGVIALCDFGGTGASITLIDAAGGYQSIGATARHAEFSGELIDRALLAHVIADLSIGGTSDVAGTAAFRSLHRLRAECRGAKERLSRGAVTTLFADVPGFRGDVRLTRAELDGEIRQPLAAFIDALREHLFRNRIHPADLSAVASIGGGASIPAVTTALSDQLRVPVISTPHPELTAAHGAALLAVRRPEDEILTAFASPVQSTAMRPLAWSEVDNVPEIAPFAIESEPPAGLSAARPRVDFVPEDKPARHKPSAVPWYRPLLVTAGVFAAMVLVGTGAVLAIRNDASAMTGTTTTTTTVQPDPAAPAAAPPIALAVTPEQTPNAPSYIRPPAPVTRVVVTTPPPVVMQAPAPAAAPPPPTADNPRPVSAPPPSAPPTSTPTTTSTPNTTSPPPSSPPSGPPSSAPSEPPSSPPSSAPPSSEPSTPPSPDKPPGEQTDQPDV